MDSRSESCFALVLSSDPMCVLLYRYDPWNQDYRGRSGYCVLSLRIALWYVRHSLAVRNPSEFAIILSFFIDAHYALTLLSWLYSNVVVHCSLSGRCTGVISQVTRPCLNGGKATSSHSS